MQTPSNCKFSPSPARTLSPQLLPADRQCPGSSLLPHCIEESLLPHGLLHNRGVHLAGQLQPEVTSHTSPIQRLSSSPVPETEARGGPVGRGRAAWSLGRSGGEVELGSRLQAQGWGRTGHPPPVPPPSASYSPPSGWRLCLF